MRPPEFTGGKGFPPCKVDSRSLRFNEAAGIHRRKARVKAESMDTRWASMRPPEFTGGKVMG